MGDHDILILGKNPIRQLVDFAVPNVLSPMDLVSKPDLLTKYV